MAVKSQVSILFRAKLNRKLCRDIRYFLVLSLRAYPHKPGISFPCIEQASNLQQKKDILPVILTKLPLQRRVIEQFEYCLGSSFVVNFSFHPRRPRYRSLTLLSIPHKFPNGQSNHEKFQQY